MADISIRSMDDEERLDVLYTHGMYAFRASPPFQDIQDFSLRDWGDPTPEIQFIMREMSTRDKGKEYTIEHVFCVYL